jgi:hypothetical protein
MIDQLFVILACVRRCVRYRAVCSMTVTSLFVASLVRLILMS